MSLLPTSTSDFQCGDWIKNTTSLCPRCLAHIDAGVYRRHGQVWLDKRCPEHGTQSALLASNAAHYYRASEQTASPSCCGSGCGSSALSNHSCNVIIEITERCNLSCPTCFADSSPHKSKQLSLEEFRRQVDRLVANGKGQADLIQLSGGEPTIHPELFEMIEALGQRGFARVCINTNGIKLANEDFAERLAQCATDVSIYLQFDGFAQDTHRRLRGRKDFLATKHKALANCQRLGIPVVPVMTLTQGINHHEVGALVQLGVDSEAVRSVVLQPAMYSGRYRHPQRQDRITMADAIALVCDQCRPFSAADFGPIPCSDPNCFSMAVALRTAEGLIPISRYFPRYEDWNEPANQALIAGLTDTLDGTRAITQAIGWAASHDRLRDLSEVQIDALLDGLMQWQAQQRVHPDDRLWDALFVVAIKPFMDAETYDQDRIDQCCVHILDGAGNPVSFCEYNALHRPQLSVT